MGPQDQFAAMLRQAMAPLRQQIVTLQQQVNDLQQRPMTPEEEINAIPGRRVYFTMTQSQAFTSATANGSRGSAIAFPISADGVYIMTHFPQIVWKVTAPGNATNFGAWRPPYSWPLPLQDFISGDDVIDVSYELTDNGPTRNMQDNPVPGILSSSPGNLIKLPMPTRYEASSTITIVPTYERISLNSSGTASTGGTLYISLIGYKIITALGQG